MTANNKAWAIWKRRIGGFDNLLPVAQQGEYDPVAKEHGNTVIADPRKTPTRYLNQQGTIYGGVAEWTTIGITAELYAKWKDHPAGHGVALRLGFEIQPGRFLCALDVDTEDGDALDAVDNVCAELQLMGNERYREHSDKFLRLFTLPTETSKIIWKLPDGRGAVELLGKGQQCIVNGDHDKGHAQWHWNMIPHLDSLAELTRLLDGVGERAAVRNESVNKVTLGGSWDNTPETYALLVGAGAKLVGNDLKMASVNPACNQKNNHDGQWMFRPIGGDADNIVFRSFHADSEGGMTLRDALKHVGGDAWSVYERERKAYAKSKAPVAIANFTAKGRDVGDTAAAAVDSLLPQTEELLQLIENKLYGFCGWEGSAEEFGVDVDALDYVLRNVGASRSKASGHLFYVGKFGKLGSQKPTDLRLALMDLGIERLFRPTRDALDAIRNAGGLKLDKMIEKLKTAEDPDSKKRVEEAEKNAAAAKASSFHKTLDELLSDALQREPNQFTTLRREIDMYASSASVWIDGEGTMTASQPHTPFASGPYDMRHIRDYLQHFPEADEFLQFVAASRFAGSRKTAYLWLHAPSDWGKGFLMEAFKRAGAVIEFDASAMKDLLKGANTGKTDGDFIRAWLCVINECREIVPEMRKMENSVGLNTKYALSTEVPLYAKLFTSADGVNGLNSELGAEEQLCNRFNYMAGQGQIKNRPLFQAERGAYNRSVFNWVAHRLNELVDYYRSLGREAAADTADDYLLAFHQRHGLALSTGIMADSYGDVRADFVKWCHEQLASSQARYHDALTSRCVRCDDGMVLRSVKKTFDEYLEEHHAASDVVWMAKDWKIITGVTDKMQRWPGIEKPFKGLLLKQ